MPQYKIPPFAEKKMFGPDGNPTKAWRTWYDQTQYLTNRTVSEQVLKDWRMPLFPGTTYSANQTLTANDLGQNILFSCGTSNLICTLPLGSGCDVNSWITIIRTGTGTLTIKSSGLDIIETSVPGGSIWCNETNRLAANITLLLVNSTSWGMLSGFGIWKVR